MEGGRQDYCRWKVGFGLVEIFFSSISVGNELGVGNWFMDNLGRIVGDGSAMLFWWDHWWMRVF